MSASNAPEVWPGQVRRAAVGAMPSTVDTRSNEAGRSDSHATIEVMPKVVGSSASGAESGESSQAAIKALPKTVNILDPNEVSPYEYPSTLWVGAPLMPFTGGCPKMVTTCADEDGDPRDLVWTPLQLSVQLGLPIEWSPSDFSANAGRLQNGMLPTNQLLSVLSIQTKRGSVNFGRPSAVVQGSVLFRRIDEKNLTAHTLEVMEAFVLTELSAVLLWPWTDHFKMSRYIDTRQMAAKASAAMDKINPEAFAAFFEKYRIEAENKPLAIVDFLGDLKYDLQVPSWTHPQAAKLENAVISLDYVKRRGFWTEAEMDGVIARVASEMEALEAVTSTERELMTWALGQCNLLALTPLATAGRLHCGQGSKDKNTGETSGGAEDGAEVYTVLTLPKWQWRHIEGPDLDALTACAMCFAQPSEVGKFLAFCERCGTRYCGRQCQVAHWSEHKRVCKLF